MVALTEGTRAPEISLPALDGSSYSLERTLKASPVAVLAFFKVSCPVCQLTLPYIERIHRSYRSIPIWGVSQDDTDATEAFARMYGLTFPMLLDERLASTVDYDLTNVPTVFLVDSSGVIKVSSVGFSREELEQVNKAVAEAAGQQPVPLFTPADEVPDYKPG